MVRRQRIASLRCYPSLKKETKTMLNHKGFYSVSIEKTIEPYSDIPLIKPIQAKQIKGDAASGPEDVYRIMKFLEKADREMLYALHLNAKNRIIAMELVSMGNLTNSLIHPREVFKGAILNNAAFVILVHNHPSGDAEPSQEDLKMTEKVIKAGEILGIPVIDHIEQSKEMTKGKHTDSAINALIRANENLKGKKSLTTAEIKNLSKTLRKSTYKMFLTKGVSESYLKECYSGTARQLKGKSFRR
jgi:proteasome lid subunit RPN8/RPN11